jgi:hypothetical protein
MFVSCECCVLSVRGLCDWPITRPEESYRLWCVWVWSRKHDKRKPRPTKAVEPLKKSLSRLILACNCHIPLPENALCDRVLGIDNPCLPYWYHSIVTPGFVDPYRMRICQLWDGFGSVAALPLRSLEGESCAHTLSDWADFSNGIGISCVVTRHHLDTLCPPLTGLHFILRVHYQTSLEMTVVAYPTSWLSSAA